MGMMMRLGMVFGLTIATLVQVNVAEAVAVTLDERCSVHILNRNIQVQKDGSWAMPNVPSTMGKVRARATCVQNGVTHRGQTEYFRVISGESTDVNATFTFGGKVSGLES
ncbi:MAG: hypothetical protein AUK35_06345 [Zetaproteobacteria bacterium CG2_30_46_52]|nr:MAG: hypothetical protein AUK35_06345 [Zetaproteobacteria bacterium CG2_30_46_52]